MVSRSGHDFRRCECQAVFVDGGRQYTRVGGKREDWELVQVSRWSEILVANVVTACALSQAHENGWWSGAGYRATEDKPYTRRRLITFTNGNRDGGRMPIAAAG